ncbi:biosynthesis cluster domain-containing protein [Kitasatospora azatica]|uniref:biosynthesis cluster domain-containing protein n=1 Tax=Kitasatospora azatica TaxID=58347 RepID=UPI00068A11EE|nr:biosynthesis cluster domain-containing protein [Kitasatospora azatica]
MSDLLALPASPLVLAQVERTGPASVRRLVTVRPGMCGSLQALAACVGDWTWETVSTVCGFDVFRARDPRGTPSYLAFYYYRIASGGDLHPRRLSFGDRLEVQSLVFDAGRLSVLTVHRLRLVADSDGPDNSEPFDLAELRTKPRPDCLYIENLNVWVARGDARSNVGLVHAPPTGFAQARLPRLPDEYSPRALCTAARSAHDFPDPARDGWPRSGPDLIVDHAVDPVHDINGVGLLYFASFFSIVERAQLQRWRSLGRSDRSFLDRAVLDTRICYLGNADLDATLRLRLRSSVNPDDPAEEATDVAVHDLATDRTIVVARSLDRRR